MISDKFTPDVSEGFLLKRRWWTLPLLLWTAIIAWSLYKNIDAIREHNLSVARTSSQYIFRMVELTRLWNARHGGVYVPISQHARPNEYLDVPNRDIETLDGVKLTMINPAYMTRQLTELLAESAPVSFHITSLKPIRPQNRADFWESQALNQFERGVDEYYERINHGKREIFRYMAPLLVKQPCMKCHEKQGYQVGDIRGGISVTLQAGFIFANQQQAVWLEVAKHSAVYLLVSALLLLFFTKMRRQWLRLRQIEAAQDLIIDERTRELQELVIHDSLTGLYNRKALDEHFKIEIQRAERYAHYLSIFVIDIDHFKQINDRHNHQTGDKVLQSLGQVLQKSIRNTDFAARYGGEEFVITLPETGLQVATRLAERLRESIADTAVINDDGEVIRITASIGVAVFPEHAKSIKGLIRAADEAMYSAKKKGRNQVYVAAGE